MRAFRIFLAEDEDLFAQQLILLLRRAMPLARIERARTVSKGRKLIETAFRSGELYDLAILDFKLPANLGENPEVDEFLCRTLTHGMPSAVIGHITSFRGDKLVVEHVDRAHPPNRARGFVLDKLDADFGTKLVNETRQALYSQAVEAGIRDLLFPERADSSPESGNRDVRTSGGSSTQHMDLMLDIIEAWPHLSEAAKSVAKRYFEVDESGTPLAVWLRTEALK